jgi:hypothetical protein
LSPLTVQEVAPVVVQVLPPLPDTVTVYDVMVPLFVPLSVGAVQFTVTAALPADAKTAVGALGSPLLVVHHGEKVTDAVGIAVTGEPVPLGLALALYGPLAVPQ